MTVATAADVLDLPLGDVGLDPRPVRRIRALDADWVRHLAEDTDPAEWDPIEVRPWPPSDPYPPGEEGRPWQVISGYHRTSAARWLDLPTLRGTVRRDVDTDTAFTVRALRGNLRHGKPMSAEEQRAVVRRLRALDMSEGAIAAETGIPRGTVHNWLSGRDTNAARSVRTHQAKGDAAEGDDGIDPAWRAAPVRPDVQLAARIGGTISDFLARTPSGLEPSQVVGWVGTLDAPTCRSLAEDVGATVAWLANLRAVLDKSSALSGCEEGGAA